MTDMKEVQIVKTSNFSGVRKVGLDSSVIIDLVDNPQFFANKATRMFGRSGLFYTHKICFWESVKILSRDKGWTEDEAKSKVFQFMKERNVIVLNDSNVDYGKFNEMANLCKSKHVKFHEPDSLILYHFKNNGINTVWSADNHFLDAARLFGIIAEKFPTFDKELDNIFRDIFRK